ncbi:MAG: hypothetical protein OHK0039_09430 [Bacteroidia bacterium]
MKQTTLALVASLLLVAACKPETLTEKTGDFELNIALLAAGQAFELGTAYQNVEGRAYTFDEFKLYIGDLTLVKADGEELKLADAILYDFRTGTANKTTHGPGVAKLFEVPAGAYKGVKFGVGVPARLNGLDPATYTSSHPLSVSQGTHWTWATGYIFVKMDGRIDSSAARTGALSYGLTYHMGTSDLYREVSYLDADHAFEVAEGEELQFKLELDVNRFFYNSSDTIDMVTRNITHSTPVGSEAFGLARRIMDNLVDHAMYKMPF